MQRVLLKIISKYNSVNLRTLGSKTSGRPSSDNSTSEDLLESIQERIQHNRNILKRHSPSQLKARELNKSVSNLRQSMSSVKNKQKAAFEPSSNSIVNIPSQVSIEILGNGTGLLQPCFILRTPLKTYMFNCPENASRFLWQLRIRSSSVVDFFITSAKWDNIAGISSILLSKESNAMPTRLHGAMNIKHFLECIRPFQDSDYGNCKYPSQVEESPYTVESYEDAGLHVSYIPLSPPLKSVGTPLKPNEKSSNVDIAYLIKLKEPARRIDAKKLMELKVPKGPMIGKLKNGETITLPDGRIITPNQVFSSDQTIEEKPTLLVVDCSTESHAQALIDSSAIQKYLKGSEHIDYVVHLSNDLVIKSHTYSTLMSYINRANQNTDKSTIHLLMNDNNPVVPAVESVYKHTRLLRRISPALFPQLHPVDWAGIVTQNDELSQKQEPYIRVAPLQRYWMRHGKILNEEPIINDLRVNQDEFKDDITNLIKEYQEEENLTKETCEFPKLTFFGTSSAVPSKYRNVTGYLVEASDESAFMVDVGEGTYGQMRAVFGEEGCKKLLTTLHCVMITHAHQDHMNGLYTFVDRRKAAFDELGLKYRPLVLVCNRNVMKPMKTYSICFENLEPLLEVVDISRHPLTPPASPNGPPGKRPRLPSPHLPPARDILPDLPQDLFDEKLWKLEELKAVQVHHTRMANGFVMRVAGKRLVFSGDTKPCDLLVEEGIGADVLVHEATFEDGHEKDALYKRHSTMGQAVDIAKRMNAKHVILTHFSARYPKVPMLPDYLDTLKIGVAMDMLRVRFDHLHLLPKLLPIYRMVFAEELFELTIKKEQRALKEQEAVERGAKIGEKKKWDKREQIQK